jgi:hypothetical protein
MKKWAALSVCSLLGFAWSERAAAQEPQRDCSAVYDAALDAEREGDLRTALVFYESCAVDSCANPARRSCEARAMRLELDAPSVVPLAQSAAGEPLVDAQVTMDGKLLASRLDGRAVAVEPGLHEFVFSKDGEVIGKLRTVVAQGQRNRELWMTEPAPEPEPQRLPTIALRRETAATVSAPRAAIARGESSGSVMPYVLGGTALLGGGAYALLSTWARDDNQKLDACAPNCPKESVQHIRTLYLAADISLGVAIAAAVGSVATILLGSSGSADKPAPKRSFAFAVQPSRHGALATFKGTL